MKKNYHITCSDAGAANLIYHWYVANKKRYFFSFDLSGPAKKIFKKNLTKLNLKTDYIVTGTGKIKKKYISTIKYGKKNNIKTISFVDHYTNYGSRFFYNKSLVLPNEVWVFDKTSFLLAKKFYKKSKIILKKNYYLKFLIKNYLIYKKKKNKKNNILKILFVSEPYLIKKNLVKIIVNNIYNFIKKYNKKIKLVLRQHPSEKSNYLLNYLNYKFKKDSNIKISFDDNLKIAKSLYESDIVIGGDTYALVLASKLNKKVCTFLPIKKNLFHLPLKKVIKI
jgi:hypothetical protein